jgi:murein L,D-transpeptidase YafK
VPGIARVSLALVGLIALAGLSPAAARSAGHRPADEQVATLSIPPLTVPDRLVVMKSQHRLVLMRGDRVIKMYRVALGRYPEGAKVEEGDERTPEGAYVIDRRLADSNFYKAIHISYPNAQDRARARALGVKPGGAIMIHGLPNDWTARQVGHPFLDWTTGCIAVTDREMDELWRVVRIGTPIYIYP